jgi:hypothetical protein
MLAPSSACLLAVAALACVAPGEATSPEQLRTRRRAADLSLGSPYEDVVALLGDPECSEVFRRSPDRSVRFLFYRTGPSAGPERGRRSGLEPLAIEYGKLSKKDWSYYGSVSARFPRQVP